MKIVEKLFVLVDRVSGHFMQLTERERTPYTVKSLAESKKFSERSDAETYANKQFKVKEVTVTIEWED